MSPESLKNEAGFEFRILCFRGQRLYHKSSAIVVFGALKKGLQQQRYEAKSRNKNLTILVDSESEVSSSTAIVALQLSAVGRDLESRPNRIVDTN